MSFGWMNVHNLSRFIALLMVRLPQTVCSCWKMVSTRVWLAIQIHHQFCNRKHILDLDLEPSSPPNQANTTQAKTPKNKSIKRSTWWSKAFELGTSLLFLFHTFGYFWYLSWSFNLGIFKAFILQHVPNLSYPSDIRSAFWVWMLQ